MLQINSPILILQMYKLWWPTNVVFCVVTRGLVVGIYIIFNYTKRDAQKNMHLSKQYIIQFS